MIRAPDDSPSAARPAWHSMNTNDLLAFGGAHGSGIGIGPILLALLVLGGLAYGVTRRRQRPSTKPDPPFPRADAPTPTTDQARPRPESLGPSPDASAPWPESLRPSSDRSPSP